MTSKETLQKFRVQTSSTTTQAMTSLTGTMIPQWSLHYFRGRWQSMTLANLLQDYATIGFSCCKGGCRGDSSIKLLEIGAFETETAED
jgi:hypothetical protein